MMPSEKIFAEQGHIQLRGDYRGVTIRFQFRKEFWDWCVNNGFQPEYQGSLAGLDLWYVKDEKNRVLTILRWS
jgi:hypothetical protein